MILTCLKFPKWLISEEGSQFIHTLQKQIWKANYTRQAFHRLLLMYFTLANIV